ncbi:mannose-6-phosphate isomerase, class I [Alteribacter natronophilus]|uniref:mannose-6-phosphate isomerase, class I n=1 Tax=Alteribacter natronophilus TaxID=2583810 RepID=UPI00110EAE41|nr:mannose-6-phosphate isomerase, class I [Alteribacter natronophilus]TMW72389.1 mannose-6-phosphate isomerase, class I [Alteribacter natronophilus]
MSSILFLSPVFKEKIWGGDRLEKQFNYPIPSGQTGECWGISGHENGTNEVLGGPYAGKTVRALWENHRELFNSEPGDEFPLLVKIIDAQDDLSVQVHPDDEYAKEHENYAFGKTECWYILDRDPGAKLILGHSAETRGELSRMVDKGQWDELFRDVPVEKGDFYYVPSGTVHAIGKGIMILEIQQSSDITYRFYDYDRTDDTGSTRDLHIEDSVACSMVPHEDVRPERTETQHGDLSVTRLIRERYFTVDRWELNGQTSQTNDHYLLMSVIEGEGTITADGEPQKLKKGDHFIIPATVRSYDLSGSLTIMSSQTTR